MRPSAPFAAAFVAAVGAMQISCNDYDLFRVGGYQQETFTNRADVLFVIDNSESMTEIATEMALNFAAFLDQLGGVRETRTFDGLADAVTNYIEETQIITGAVDFQFAITTTDVGEAQGNLVGPLVRRTDDDVTGKFLQGLLCGATCFDTVQSRSHRCGDPLGAVVSEEYLDCECGERQWQGNCGTAVEEGLESVFLTLCRAVDNPPRACFEDVLDEKGDVAHQALLTPDDRLSNADLLRENANLIVAVVTDEGDGSRRLDREEIPDIYEELFAQFNRNITWVLIGPDLNKAQTDLACPGTGSDFGVIRYNYLTFTTSGLTIPLYDEYCDVRDFGEALQELSSLLTNLRTSFALASIPVADTIRVFIDGRRIREAEFDAIGAFGLPQYGSGWTYRSADNSIQFWGDAIPPYEADVEVFYLPVDGIPRDLPF